MPGRPIMAVQTSPDFLKFPRTPAGKTREVRFFVNPPVIFPNTGKLAQSANEQRWAVLILAKVGGS